MVEDCVARGLATIGYRQGPAHAWLKLKLTADGPRIIEVNPLLRCDLERPAPDREPAVSALAAPSKALDEMTEAVHLHPAACSGAPGRAAR